MRAGPGDETAGAAGGRGGLRASHADRDQVIGTLKAAFVEGRLTKDELDARVGQTFASRTYAELAAVTADLPAWLAGAQPARARARPPAGNAVKAGMCVVIAVATMVAAAFATGGAALSLFVPFYLVALVIAGAQIRESRSRGHRRPPPRPSASGTGRTASGRAGRPRRVGQAERHPGGHCYAIGYR